MTKSFLPIAAITCGLLSCMASGVYGQMGTPTYSPGPEMIVGEIQHYVMGTEVEPYDRYSIGQTYRKASHLKDANTGNFIAFDWTQSQDLEYHLGQDAMGNNLWKKFATVKHKREYKATKEARMTCEASNTMSSNWAGAWRAKQGINVVVP